MNTKSIYPALARTLALASLLTLTACGGAPDHDAPPPASVADGEDISPAESGMSRVEVTDEEFRAGYILNGCQQFADNCGPKWGGKLTPATPAANFVRCEWKKPGCHKINICQHGGKVSNWKGAWCWR